MNQIRSIFLILLLVLAVKLAYSDESPKNVLILHSYNQGYTWTDNINRGIMDYFHFKSDVLTDIEYLDSQQYSGAAYAKAFLQLQKVKYLLKNRPEAVIVADNPAFEFILSNGNELFPGIPVIFCGINNFRMGMIRGRTNITGVVEEISMKETLEVVFRLHPHSKRIYVCVRDDPTGRANREVLLSALSNMQRRVDIHFIDDDSVDDAAKKVGAVSREDIIMVMTSYKSSHGVIMPAELSTKILLSNSVAPVYSLWDFYMGNGIIGGKLVSGYDQGSNAAAMAWRVLQGEDIRNIPVLLKSPNRFMFDYGQMARFGIGAGRLPAGSVIYHLPVSLFEKYKSLFIFLFVVLFILIGFLVIYAYRQRKSGIVLLELSQFQLNLFDSIPNPVYYKDLKKNYTGCNKSFEDFYGLTKERIIGKTVFDLFPKEQAELFDRKDRELILTGEKQVFETDISRADGSIRRVISLKSIFYRSNRQPLGIIGVFIDITEQKRLSEEMSRAREKAEQMNLELEASRNYLNKIINSISDPVFVKDSGHRWVLINDAYCEFMGYKREELLGKTDRDYFPKGQADVFWENDDIVFRSLFENISEEEFTDKSGRTHTILTKKSLYIDGHKNKYIVGIISDITERKKLENELKLMNQNLGEKVWEEVNKNREKDLILIKQSRQASMGEMIRNIAHQWRQPLNALGIIIQNIREQYRFGKLDAEYIDKSVNKAVDLVQFMSRTIDDFKNFFKPDKEAARFSVKEALFRAVSVVEASMKNNFIELNIQLEKDVTAVGYPNEYSQVVLNILSNAKDILLENRVSHPSVRIILSELDGRSELLIWNNGGEIPEDVISHVFEPYFTTKESGTGIGLYMSKMIIEKNMNGKIGVRNFEGGAEFRVLV